MATWLDGSGTARTAAYFESLLAQRRVFNVESPEFGAVADDFYEDGYATSASTTFTSATANFTADDVGKTLMILSAGPSSAQDLHTTISSVTNSTTVVMAHAAGRTKGPTRFWISRGGDSTSAIQAAIDAAGDAGGGIVDCPGVGYLVTTLTLPNRVWIRGRGRRATCLHQKASTQGPVIQNDQTLDNTANFVKVSDMWIDGNRYRQSRPTTTLAANYTAGSGTITLTNGSVFQNSGWISIGSNRLYYTTKSGNTLTGVVGGYEDTTDASALAGATVTAYVNHGITIGNNPYNSGGANQESFDTWAIVDTVYIKNCKDNGVENHGQSEIRILNTWAHYAEECGFRPSFDSFLANCSADTCGRSGFYFRSSDLRVTGCKSYYSGGNTGSAGHGFFVDGPAGGADGEGTKVFAGCSAQDNKAHGFYLRNTNRVVISGHTSSNSTTSVGTYSGVCLDGARGCIVDIVSTERVAAPNNSQQNAVAIYATDRAGYENQIRVTHGGVGSVAVGAAVHPSSVFTDGHHILVNGQGSTQLATYSATVTPDPYSSETYVMTLTGNITFNAPTNGHPGCKLRFILKQDATGGRTMTFNSVFKTSGTASALVTTANKTNSIEFLFDGTSWWETARSVNI